MNLVEKIEPIYIFCSFDRPSFKQHQHNSSEYRKFDKPIFMFNDLRIIPGSQSQWIKKQF